VKNVEEMSGYLNFGKIFIMVPELFQL